MCCIYLLKKSVSCNKSVHLHKIIPQNSIPLSLLGFSSQGWRGSIRSEELRFVVFFCMQIFKLLYAKGECTISLWYQKTCIYSMRGCNFILLLLCEFTVWSYLNILLFILSYIYTICAGFGISPSAFVKTQIQAFQ